MDDLNLLNNLFLVQAVKGTLKELILDLKSHVNNREKDELYIDMDKFN